MEEKIGGYEKLTAAAAAGDHLSLRLLSRCRRGASMLARARIEDSEAEHEVSSVPKNQEISELYAVGLYEILPPFSPHEHLLLLHEKID